MQNDCKLQSHKEETLSDNKSKPNGPQNNTIAVQVYRTGNCTAQNNR